jgi:hypothetical protein
MGRGGLSRFGMVSMSARMKTVLSWPLQLPLSPCVVYRGSRLSFFLLAGPISLRVARRPMGSAPPVKTLASSFFPRRTKVRLLAAASLQKSFQLRCSAFASPRSGFEGVPLPMTVSPSRGDRLLANNRRNKTMTAIGYVTRNDNGSYRGQLRIGATGIAASSIAC